MTCSVSNIRSYDFSFNDELLLDTNVWLSVYGPQKPGDAKAEIYSQAFSKILAAKSDIYIDVLIVSEFINTYARLKWRLVTPHVKEFKLFRKSPDFKPVAQDIAADIRRVLQHCKRVESGFESLAIDAVIDQYAAGESDFNDQILADLCQRNGLALVTHDGDFKDCGCPVITANIRLLA